MISINNLTVVLPHNTDGVLATQGAVSSRVGIDAPGILDRVLNIQALGSSVSERKIEDFKSMLDASTFTEQDQDLVINLAAALVQQQSPGLPFDPSNWEKHAGVLMAAIVAVSISRNTSAQLRGTFAVLAAEAAQSQGMAIVGAGRAAMESAIIGAAVTGAMAISGMVLTLKGQAQKPANIKGNGPAQQDHSPKTIDTQTLIPGSGSNHTPAVAVKTAASNKVSEKGKPDSGNSSEGSVLPNALNEKIYNGSMTVGQALTSMAGVLSNMLSAVVRLEEYNQREREVLEQTEQVIGKSMSDEEAQRGSEASALLQKLLDAFQQINQSRSGASSASASGMRV